MVAIAQELALNSGEVKFLGEPKVKDSVKATEGEKR
jgi:hypothetical protein